MTDTPRPIIDSIGNARNEIAGHARVTWLQRQHSLPFDMLSDGEFEVLCYLLLRAENPNDKIVYYGKTADLGRDIVHHRSDGPVSLIQCKRYAKNVGIGIVRKDIAKLMANVFDGSIPIRPDEVCFYAVPDLTSPATDLLDNQTQWRQAAEVELKSHLGKPPTKELLEFAMEWWPFVDSEQGLSLTARCKNQKDVLEEFFSVRSVIDASNAEIQDMLNVQTQTIVGGISRRAETTPVELDQLGREAIVDSFSAASQRLVAWPTTLDGSAHFERPEKDKILETIWGSTSSTSLLLGDRGSGKSSLLAVLTKELIARDCPVLGIKSDFIARTVDSEARLSQQLQLPGNISSCIVELAKSEPVVLVLDQLDALADLVDLHSERLNVLLDLVARLGGQTNVHIVASCRPFDYRHDTRLGSLSANEIDLAPPAWQDVAEVLQPLCDLDAWSLPDDIRDQLRVPQHLKSLLTHLRNNPKYDITRSYQQLLDDIWRLLLSSTNAPAGVADVLTEMAHEMANQEVLWLPEARYTDRPTLIKFLESADILYRPGHTSRIGFRHQTYFEHALARSYAAGSLNFSQHVLDRQNALFVRPIIWSTLGYLREVGRPEYLKQLRLLLAAELRRHVVYLLIDFLGQSADECEMELSIVQDWIQEPTLRSRAVLAISGNSVWFEQLDGPLLSALMELPTKDAWPLVIFLRSAWPFAKQRVLELLKTYWLKDSERDWHSFSAMKELDDWDNETVSIACSLIARFELNDHYVTDLAQRISWSAPELAPKIILTSLERDLSKIDAAPLPEVPDLPEDTSDSEKLAHAMFYQPNDKYWKLLRDRRRFYDFDEIAKAAPLAYLRDLWTWFIKVLDRVLGSPHRIRNVYRETTGLFLLLDDEVMGENEFARTLDLALKLVATESPEQFLEFASNWSDYDAEIVQRLLCRAFASNSAAFPDAALTFLIDDPRRLCLGDYRNEHRDSCALIASLVPCLDDTQFIRLVESIRAWSMYRADFVDDDPRTRRDRMIWDRVDRLRLLESLPFDRLDDATRKLILDEQTALAEHCPTGDDDDDGEFPRMQVVRSSMSSVNMQKADDVALLRFLDRIAKEQAAEPEVDISRGGMIEASRELAELAKNAPERVAKVIRKLRPSDQQEPAAHVVSELGRNDQYPANDLFQLILEMDHSGFDSDDFRGEVAHACCSKVGKLPGLPDEILALFESWLGKWSEWDYFRDEQEDSYTREGHSVIWQATSFVFPHGSYWILRALTYGYLRKTPPQCDDWLAVLEGHLSRPESIHTWRVLTGELQYLRLCDVSRATAFLGRLFATYPKVLQSTFGGRLLSKLRRFLSESTLRKFAEVIRDSEWQDGAQAYGELHGLTYLTNEDANLAAEEQPSDGKNSAVAVGLAHAVAHVIWDDPKLRDRALDLFERLAINASPETAQALMQCFSRTEPLPANPDTVRLLETIRSKPSLLDGAPDRWFAEQLESLTTYCPTLVCDICNLMVDRHSDALSNIQLEASLSADNLVKIAMTLQRLPDFRDPGLTLFERLMDQGVYDASKLLQTLDRRTLRHNRHQSVRRRGRTS